MEKLGLGGREMTSSGHSKDFVLKVVQPSLVGLMDGSVSTLAPLFATAFATGDPRITFLVGLAAAVGAAISMAFSEGLSDDGTLTGRGSPMLRGSITGVATFVGGILHTLPFLLPQVGVALYVAFGVVGAELLAISFIRYRYFRMSFFVSALQVILGGALVFASGILIGSA
jgi:VIT1/CCC1 family predicted Fe2+/Mn2+ transporter